LVVGVFLEVGLVILVVLVAEVLPATLRLALQRQAKAILAALVQRQAMLLAAVVVQVQPE
jgi:hypothetical protein